jgi:hypothetical protein
MALDVDKVFRFVQFVANKESRGWITIAEFNIAAELAQIAVYSKREAVFLQSKKILNDMRPFMKLSAAITPSSGKCAYPTSMRHFIRGWVDSTYKPITELTQAELADAMDSSIIAPAASYLACVQRDDGLQLYPVATAVDIRMEYLIAPTAPEWVDTLAGARPIYDSGNSTDFEFDDILFLEIASLVLMNVGMNIKDESVVQYGMAFNQAK